MFTELALSEMYPAPDCGVLSMDSEVCVLAGLESSWLVYVLDTGRVTGSEASLRLPVSSLASVLRGDVGA
jgi:hypothetical protein